MAYSNQTIKVTLEFCFTFSPIEGDFFYSSDAFRPSLDGQISWNKHFLAVGTVSIFVTVGDMVYGTHTTGSRNC